MYCAQLDVSCVPHLFRWGRGGDERDGEGRFERRGTERACSSSLIYISWSFRYLGTAESNMSDLLRTIHTSCERKGTAAPKKVPLGIEPRLQEQRLPSCPPRPAAGWLRASESYVLTIIRWNHVGQWASGAWMFINGGRNRLWMERWVCRATKGATKGRLGRRWGHHAVGVLPSGLLYLFAGQPEDVTEVRSSNSLHGVRRVLERAILGDAQQPLSPCRSACRLAAAAQPNRPPQPKKGTVAAASS
jgi:hypothetical protein